MKALYLSGPDAGIDAAIAEQLAAAAPDVQLTTAGSSAEALIELRKPLGWQALLISPGVSQNEMLALIASLRRDRVPIAIVPVIDERHQDVYAAAVSSGADDVLVRRGQSLANVRETLVRIRQSPHLFPAEQRRRLAVLYAGRDTLVWNLLEQVPFIRAERVNVGPDGSCPVRVPGAEDGRLRCDVVVVDEQPGEAHPLQVVKSVKAQASDLPVVVLTSTGAGDIATAALELGADDTVLKSGIFRRRLMATLRRVHQRVELLQQQADTRAREERLRQIVERVPAAIAVVSADGAVLAMNGEAQRLFGAERPREVVGRDFRTLVAAEFQDAATDLLHRVTRGEPGELELEGLRIDGARTPLTLRAAVLERDARGGRGMIVTFAPPSSGLAGPPVDTAAMAAAREQIDRFRAELEAARENEQQLLARLAAAEEALRDGEQVRDRLLQTEQAQRELEARLVEERIAWQSTDEALRRATTEIEARDARVAELERALRSTEEALDETRADLALAAQAREADLEAERTRWAAARQTLDADRQARADELAEAARTIEVLRAELAAIEERHARQRDADRIEAARAAVAVASESHEARLSAERAEWESARDRIEGQRREIEAAFDAARREWQQVRERLDAGRAEADAALAQERGEVARLREALEAARGEIGGALEAERGEWLQAREALERQLADADHARQDLERRLGDAERARQDLERQLGETDRTRQDLERQLGEAAQARRDLEWQLGETRAAVDAARGELGAALDRERAEAQRLRDELDAIRRDLGGALDRERGEWHQAREALERQLAEAGQARQDLERRLGEAEHARQDVERRLGDADQARQDLERRLGEADQARQDLERRLGEAEQARRDLEWQLGETRAAADATRGGLSGALDQERAEAQRLRDELDARTRDAESRLAAETARIDAARADAERARRDLDETLAAERLRWTAARTELETTIAELRAQAGSAEAAQAALDAARAELGHTDAERTRERDAWAAARAALEQEIAAAIARHQETDAAWRAARDELVAHTTEIETLRRERQQMADALTALRTDYAAMVQSLAAERTTRERDAAELDVLRRSLAAEQTLRADLEQRLGQAEAGARDRIAARETEMAALARDLQQQIAELGHHLEASQAEAARARTALELAEARLAEEQDRMMASPLLGYAVATREGQVRRCNDTFAQLFGYAGADDLMNRNGAHPFPPLADRPEIGEQLDATGRVDRIDTCVDRIDGRALRILEAARLLPAGPDGQALVEHTMVELRTLEPTDALQARRLEEVGALATAMAPGIESVIAELEARSRRIDEHLARGSHPDEDVAAAVALAGQGVALVRQLAAFSRRQIDAVEAVDLNDAIRHAEPMLAQLVGGYIGFDVRLGPGGTVSANLQDLDQLLTSMITFGRDVLPAGGALLVETSHVAPGTEAAGGSREPGTLLSVTATGYGAQAPTDAPAVALVAIRCGGELRLTSQAGWMLRLDVWFPRCGRTGRSGRSWLAAPTHVESIN